MAGRLIVVAAALALLALACSGDGGRGAQPPGSLTPVISPNLPPSGRAPVEALRLYLQETGLDGDKGDLTDPVDCRVAESVGADGEFCIVVDAGHYAPALAILFVTRRDSGLSWEVRVNLDVEEDAWEVTSADPLGGG